MKKTLIVILTAVIVIVGVLLFLDRVKSNSVQKEVLNEISQDHILKISIERYSDNASTTITDKKIMNDILDDLASAELRKVKDFSSKSEYAIRIYLNQDRNLGLEITDDQDYMTLFKDNSHVRYKVVSKHDFLRTIEALELKTD